MFHHRRVNNFLKPRQEQPCPLMHAPHVELLSQEIEAPDIYVVVVILLSAQLTLS